MVNKHFFTFVKLMSPIWPMVSVGLWAWVAHVGLTGPKTHWMSPLTEDMSFLRRCESRPIRMRL